MGEAKRRRAAEGDDYWKGRNPMDVKFALVADHVSETREGKMVIVGIFDTISAPTAPATHPSLFVTARLETSIGSGTKHKMRLGMWDEDGREVIPLSGELDLPFVSQGPGRPLRAQLILQFNLLTFPRFGDYEFRILVAGVQVAAIPVRLQSLVVQP